jgi:dTDP-4-dehydrorhamnose 3,5-epimerase-like enzyme
MQLLPKIISSGQQVDERGKLIFFNELNLQEVKRLYIIEHPDLDKVRAWQAHKKEQKWFFVIEGCFKVVIVQPDDWDEPSENLPIQEFKLEAKSNQVLYIPGNYANGFKALIPGSKMIVFSDFTVEESSNDNFRFAKTLWYKWGYT